MQTKLFKPALRPSLITRPHLIAQLNAGLGQGTPGFAARLTLVSAPAGFGKTTLIAEWIQHNYELRIMNYEAENAVHNSSLRPFDFPFADSGLRQGAQGRHFLIHNFCWLSLDEADNDPVRFLSYLIAALQTAVPGIGQTAVHLLQSPQPPAAEAILTLLINDVSQSEQPIILVLDDYHVIDTPAVHQALTFLLEHLPPLLHLLIATRSDSPLPLSRLRARGQIVEIRANDLRFTVDEAGLFLNEVMGLTLSNEETAALEQRTEGWVAGLQLAALSMQGRSDLPDFISAFSGGQRFILDYLTDEVLERRPPGTRNFLLQTSILDRFCGPLCDAVTGQSESQAILEQLEEANLFLVPLDEERHWYRYHHLFADVLRKRLQQAASAPAAGVVATAELHRRASAWFEQEGLIDEAIRHALAAPDVERAASLVERYSLIMRQRSEIFRIRAWLAQLPAELIQTRPRLILAHGWTLILTGHTQALEQWLAAPQASAALAAPDLAAGIRGELALLRATLARFRRENVRSLELAQEALRHLSDDEQGLQATVMYAIGVAQLHQGEIAAARQAFTETVILGEAKGIPYATLIALQDLCQLQIRQGQLSQAIQTCQQAMRTAAYRGWQAIPAAGMAHVCLGQVLYERNDLAGAAEALADGIERLRGSIEQFVLAQGTVTLAQVQLARGDLEGALATIRRGEDWFTQMRVAATSAGILLGLGKVRLWLGQGNLNAATRWAESCHWRPEDTELGYLQAVTLIRLRLAQNRRQAQGRFLQEAVEIIDRLLAAAEAKAWRGQVIELSLLRALLCQDQGDTVGMRLSLEHALVLAEPEGYVRVFVDEGDPTRLLLTDLHSTIRQRLTATVDDASLRLLAYTEKLLAPFSQPAPAGKPKYETILEPLSQRELEILRLIATGRTNKEIAELLMIAVSTVKSHINSLYSKLGTGRRTQAIATARDLGLLSE
ncbi:MAG TPA: LuxR C-terminal-related transcriptional regulator [Anaerolineae bacterium]